VRYWWHDQVVTSPDWPAQRVAAPDCAKFQCVTLLEGHLGRGPNEYFVDKPISGTPTFGETKSAAGSRDEISPNS
jgi:hypothetical protein